MSGINARGAPKAVGSYPHARKVGGLLFLSGIGPRTAGPAAIPEGIEAQSHAVFANVRAVLEASGARWEALVDVTVFLTDLDRQTVVSGKGVSVRVISVVVRAIKKKNM